MAKMQVSVVFNTGNEKDAMLGILYLIKYALAGTPISGLIRGERHGKREMAGMV